MTTRKTLGQIAEEAYAEYGGDMEECFEAAAAAVEAEVLAQQTPMNQNGKPTQALLPLLKTAFCTIRVCSSKKQYELVFSFTDIPALHAAEEEWNKFRVATLSHPVQLAMPQLVGVANGVFGGRPCIKLLNPSLILPEGTALYAHIHFIAQPVQPASPELPEPVAHIYPSDLERFQESETFGHAYSVAVGNPDERSVPLYTLSQLVKYAAIAQSVQPARKVSNE